MLGGCVDFFKPTHVDLSIRLKEERFHVVGQTTLLGAAADGLKDGQAENKDSHYPGVALT